MPQLPEQFRDRPPRDIADFNWLTFSQIISTPDVRPRSRSRRWHDRDLHEPPSHPTRRRRRNRAVKPPPPNNTANRLVFGTGIGKRLDDMVTIEVAPDKIPQDGNYHLYPIGSITVQEGTMSLGARGRKAGRQCRSCL